MNQDDSVKKTRQILASFIDELIEITQQLNTTTAQLREAVMQDADEKRRGTDGRSHPA